MRKAYYIFFILVSLCISLFSCREGTVEPLRLLELYVVDTLGVPVPNAKVEFYFTEENLNLNTNQIIETLYTNEEGVLNVALDLDVVNYYVNIEKDNINNWYTNTSVNLSSTTEKNILTILLTDSFEAKLTGKYKKRWQQTENLINGNPSFPNCVNQLYHDFTRRLNTEKDKRDGRVEKFQATGCDFPGSSEGINQWIYDREKNTITFGIDNFEEKYQIKEFTGNRMSLVYTTPNGAFVIENRYKLIE